MARYIDVEKVDLKVVAVFDENLDLLVPLSEVRKALQMTPTADVVPRAEVAKIFAEIERLNLVRMTEDYWKIKEKYKDAEEK